ncbi:hypothetical protein [Paeniglutamicibacter kerguelensis]
MAVLFSIGGWSFGRLSVGMAPLVLAYAAIPHTLDGYASAPIWWAGTIAATLWFLFQVVFSVRQLRAVRTLAKRSSTGLTAEVGPAASAALRSIARESIFWATGLSIAATIAGIATFGVLSTELGHTYEELEGGSFSDYLATAAAILSILAIIQWVRCGWRAIARTVVGNLLWQVSPGLGPVEGLLSPKEHDAGMLPFAHAQATPGCTCIEEFFRSDPSEDEEFLEGDGVLAAAYCPAHGIDQVNSLTPEQFRSKAITTWFWDENSAEPISENLEADRCLLIGFAGHSFTGLPAQFKNGQAETNPGPGELADERVPGTGAWSWEPPKPPLGGILDRIDLRPVGLGGQAIRYSHGRAWFETGNQNHELDRR